MLDIIAIVVAICAFLVSIATPIFEFVWNKKMNRRNLEAEYFRDIYGKILYQDIPKALNYIHYNGEEVSGTDDLLDALRKIRIRSVYFKIADRKFYDKLIAAVQDLEDYIVQNPEVMSSSQFATYYGAINEKNETIYKCMSDKYIGAKVK